MGRGRRESRFRNVRPFLLEREAFRRYGKWLFGEREVGGHGKSGSYLGGASAERKGARGSLGTGTGQIPQRAQIARSHWNLPPTFPVGVIRHDGQNTSAARRRELRFGANRKCKRIV